VVRRLLPPPRRLHRRVWARARAVTLLGQEPALPADAARLEATVDAIPSWLEGFVHNPNEFMYLRAEVGTLPSDRSAPIEAYPSRSRSATPRRSAGDRGERPVNSRMLLTPSVWVGKDRVDDSTTMEVVSMARRLRLMPQEALTVSIRADNGWLWRKLALAGDKEIKIRWRVIQGFRITLDHVALAGPLCLYAETSVLTRPPTPLAAATPVALGAMVQTGTPEQVAQAILSAGWRWSMPAAKAGLPKPRPRHSPPHWPPATRASTSPPGS